MKCCGREMRNENGVLVCGKCGSSYQSSTTGKRAQRHGR